MAKKYLDYDGLAYFWTKITSYVGGSYNVLFNTKAGWDDQRDLVSAANTVYVYTDYQTDSDGDDVPNIKIGDGQAYLIDMPFINAIEMEHINNLDVHVTPEDKARWDAKVRCFVSELNSQNLVFTTD